MGVVFRFLAGNGTKLKSRKYIYVANDSTLSFVLGAAFKNPSQNVVLVPKVEHYLRRGLWHILYRQQHGQTQQQMKMRSVTMEPTIPMIIGAGLDPETGL